MKSLSLLVGAVSLLFDRTDKTRHRGRPLSVLRPFYLARYRAWNRPPPRPIVGDGPTGPTLLSVSWWVGLRLSSVLSFSDPHGGHGTLASCLHGFGWGAADATAGLTA